MSTSVGSQYGKKLQKLTKQFEKNLIDGNVDLETGIDEILNERQTSTSGRNNGTATGTSALSNPRQELQSLREKA
ncbi:unnamed protein product, partial [Amoebophrya sp. A25]|eukprot:GSA25T00022904001.1